MTNLKKLRLEAATRAAAARGELQHCQSLWQGVPGETLRAGALITGGFGAGLLFGGGGARAHAVWQMLAANVPGILQELLESQNAMAAATMGATGEL